MDQQQKDLTFDELMKEFFKKVLNGEIFPGWESISRKSMKEFKEFIFNEFEEHNSVVLYSFNQEFMAFIRDHKLPSIKDVEIVFSMEGNKALIRFSQDYRKAPALLDNLEVLSSKLAKSY